MAHIISTHILLFHPPHYLPVSVTVPCFLSTMHTLSTPIIIFLHQPEGKAESVSQSMFINLPAGSRPYTGLFRIDMPSIAEGRVPGSENIKIIASGKPVDSLEWLTQPTGKCM